MSSSDDFNLFSDDERAILASLAVVADGLKADERFITKTEAQLKEYFDEKREKSVRKIKLTWRLFAGTAALAVLIFATIWLVGSVAPDPRLPASPAETSFICPVTRGNGSRPPGETIESALYLGNDPLWTELRPDGKTIITAGNRESDGSYLVKWPWWLGVPGELSISGKRLDAPADPLASANSLGTGEVGLQVTDLIFPGVGCWEVSGHLGGASLTFVTEVLLGEEEPAAWPTSQAVLSPEPTPTATTSSGPATYEARGTTIHMPVDFPDVNAQAGLYTYSAALPATLETATTLAARFGIQGQVYKIAGDSHSGGSLLVTDGRQRLQISSTQVYTYSSGIRSASSGEPVALEKAAPVIESFLRAHGFDFEYNLKAASGMGAGWFYVLPLSLEGRAVHFDFGIPQGLSVQISPAGELLTLDANLLNIDVQPLGQFGLIDAQQAWNRYLDPGMSLGFTSTFRGAAIPAQVWTRVYPVGETVTIHGHITAVPALEEGRPPFLTLETYTLAGNTAGLENIGGEALVETQGRFVESETILKFQVDTWQVLTQYGQMLYPDSLQGSLEREGAQVVFRTSQTSYGLADFPEDISLPLNDVLVTGYLLGQNFEWQSIYLSTQQGSGGGGGGGGGNFARLNLSGTPVPWPAAQGQGGAQGTGAVIGAMLSEVEGLFIVNIHELMDGSRRTTYGFIAGQTYYQLVGSGLELLEKYHGRPVTIWGMVNGFDQDQIPVVNVERFEVPYPQLDFQILRGKQKLTTLDGQSIALFTSEDGQTYASLTPIGTPTDVLVGREGDLVEFEVLLIPAETFAGFPAMRVQGGAMAAAGQPPSLEITANRPNILTDSGSADTPRPTLTIETIELVYYTSDPRYAADYPQAMSPYLQPVWRFYGHYSDGSEVEILIQALHPDFLLPEAAESVQGG